MQPVMPTVTGSSAVAFWPGGSPPKYNTATFLAFSDDVSAACSPLMASVSFTLSDALQWSDMECDIACSNLYEWSHCICEAIMSFVFLTYAAVSNRRWPVLTLYLVSLNNIVCTPQENWNFNNPSCNHNIQSGEYIEQNANVVVQILFVLWSYAFYFDEL